MKIPRQIKQENCGTHHSLDRYGQIKTKTLTPMVDNKKLIKLRDKL